MAEMYKNIAEVVPKAVCVLCKTLGGIIAYNTMETVTIAVPEILLSVVYLPTMNSQALLEQ